MRSSIEWHCLGELKRSIVRWTLLLGPMSWYNARVMNKYLSRVLTSAVQGGVLVTYPKIQAD